MRAISPGKKQQRTTVRHLLNSGSLSACPPRCPQRSEAGRVVVLDRVAHRPGPAPELSRRHAGSASRSGPSFEVTFREVADGDGRRRSGRMAAQVLVEREAVERLTELGLSVEMIERVA